MIALLIVRLHGIEAESRQSLCNELTVSKAGKSRDYSGRPVINCQDCRVRCPTITSLALIGSPTPMCQIKRMQQLGGVRS